MSLQTKRSPLTTSGPSTFRPRRRWLVCVGVPPKASAGSPYRFGRGRSKNCPLAGHVPMNLLHPKRCHPAELAVRQAPRDKPFHRAIDGLPTGLEGARGVSPTEPPRPPRQEAHHGAGYGPLSVTPGNMLDDDPMLGTAHAPGCVAEIGRDPPQGHKQPTLLLQAVVAGRGALAARAAPTDSAMWLDADLDGLGLLLATMQAYLAVDETDEALHPIQNGLKLQLNG